VLNFLLVNKQNEVINDDISSSLSIETTPNNPSTERVYRIFLVCWVFHTIIGVITLFIDYKDRFNNPDTYYFVFAMTMKWFVAAVVTLISSLICFVIFKM